MKGAVQAVACHVQCLGLDFKESDKVHNYGTDTLTGKRQQKFLAGLTCIHPLVLLMSAFFSSESVIMSFY